MSEDHNTAIPEMPEMVPIADFRLSELRDLFPVTHPAWAAVRYALIIAHRDGYKDALAANPPNLAAKILDHKWLDPQCVETGCQSLILAAALKSIAALIEDNRDTYPEDPPRFIETRIATPEIEKISDILRALTTT